MKNLFLNIITVVCIIGTVICVIYGINSNNNTVDYKYTDNFEVELTDKGAKTMAYYYNQADKEIKAMYGFED